MVINGSTSGWQPVISRVPQGSILGLILFNIFISYLGDETECTLSKFVDSTKLVRMIDTANSRAPIQRDLEKLEDGANRNSTEFNKCKIMHVGHHHAWHLSRLRTDKLPGQTSLQHTLILNNANLILGCTMMNKASRLQEVTIPSAQCWGGHTSVPHPVLGPQVCVTWEKQR